MRQSPSRPFVAASTASAHSPPLSASTPQSPRNKENAFENALLHPDDVIYLSTSAEVDHEEQQQQQQEQPPQEAQQEQQQDTEEEEDEDDQDDDTMLSRAHTGSSVTDVHLVHSGDDANGNGLQRRSRSNQGSIGSQQIDRRESLVSNDSTGRGSNTTTPSRIHQRKMMMAQQKSLGLDAEIKAEDAANVPKRRSIFRSAGTASTPDLSTFIRGKSSKQASKPTKQMPLPTSQGQNPASSANSTGNHLSSHMSTSTSSLSTNRSSRDPRSPPTRGGEWEHNQQHPNESQRGMSMTTIAESGMGDTPHRQVSVEESKPKRKGKGMFGRMFGSSSSAKDHHSSHGPLTSQSQVSLSSRQTEMSPTSSHTSPPMASSPFTASSPKFPGNAHFAFDQPAVPVVNGGAVPPPPPPPQQQQQQRPPIPQRPSVPIVPKVEHVDPHGTAPESTRASVPSATSQADPETLEDASEKLATVAEPVHSKVHTRSASLTSNSSTNGTTPAKALRVERTEPMPRRRSGPSRQTTSEEPSRSSRQNTAASSFSDDVTGLLNRISHEVGGVRGPGGVVTHEPESSEHLQVAPDATPIAPAQPRFGSGRTYSDKSPVLGRVARSNTADENQLPDALPVPGADSAFSSPRSSKYDLSPKMENAALVPGDYGGVPDTEAAVDDVSDTDAAAPVPPAKDPATAEWVPRPAPELPGKRSPYMQSPVPTSSSGAMEEPIAIEVTGSPNESAVDLTDASETDEERGRRLACEFLDDNFTNIPADKVAEFLGGPRPVNNAALRTYMQYFDMRGAKLDQAFRDLCAKLHLKAESQEIDRIIEAFSARFFDCNPNTVFGTPGVVHTATGAMLMLNTDLHIAELQKHMSRADFVRNSMRAIQESMPDRDATTPDIQSDTTSLRTMDSLSAAQSTTSVRLRPGQTQGGTPRSASGNLVSPVSSDLNSPSMQDLRSRASSTTVNSFTYSKAWELEAENALKEIYANVRNERILLPMGGLPEQNNSSLSLGGFKRGGMGGLKRSSVRTGQGNNPYQGGGGMFTHSDGGLSPTASYPNSIDQTFNAPALGFAGNLSHTVIKEQEDETKSVHSNHTTSTLDEMTDDELALLGAPWAKEGLLQRKIQVEAAGKKANKKDWKQFFVVIAKGDLHMFVFGQGGSSSMGGTVGGGNWMSNAKTTGEYSLMHAMAMALPKPGYSATRPYCFTVTFPTGEISVFQAGTEELVAEWVAACNYWAARRSRQPLVGGVSNMEYGWTRAAAQLEDPEYDDRSSIRSQRSQMSRIAAINRMRGNSGGATTNMDKIHINEWKPPPHATIASTLDEEAQLESLLTYVQSLKEELNSHKSIEELMVRLYTATSKNALKARENWTAKSRYIHSEIFKYETYVEALRNAIALRVQRQGEKKLERSLARSTLSLHQEAKRKEGASPSDGPATSDEGGNGYVTAGTDDTRRTPK